MPHKRVSFYTVMAGLIHAHINTYVYTIVASAGAVSEASIHTHTLAHNDVSCLLCVLLYVHIYIYPSSAGLSIGQVGLQSRGPQP